MRLVTDGVRSNTILPDGFKPNNMTPGNRTAVSFYNSKTSEIPNFPDK